MTRYRLLLVVLFLASLSVGPAEAQYCEAVGCGYCGDSFCDYGEEWCETDCGNSSHCGDYICSPELGEDRYTCTTDCVCGDGVCSYGEDVNYCPSDCGCGDGVCSPGETSDHCPQDCPVVCTPDSCGSCGQPAFGDYDGDQVPDRLEYDLAHKFFPNILLQTEGDDRNQTYLFNGKSIPFTVHKGPVAGVCSESFKCLEIRYGTAYFRDIGSMGHLGDSEFYAALVMRTTSWSSAQFDASQWQIIRDFTAAHWGAGWGADSSRYGVYGYCSPNCHAWDNSYEICSAHAFDGRGCTWVEGWCTGSMNANYTMPCSWYSDEGSCYFAGGSCRWIKSQCFPNGPVCDQSAHLSNPPTLYASKGKHGLYHTPWECDQGGFLGYDSCPSSNPPYNMRGYKEGLLQNIGEDGNHGSFDITIQHPDSCTLYNVWGTAGFGGSTEYRKHFTHIFGWPLN